MSEQPSEGQRLPRRTVRTLAILMATITGGPLAFGGTVAPTGNWRIAAGIVCGALFAWILVRAARVDLLIDNRGVSIRNLFRSYSFDWEDVAAVGYGAQMGVRCLGFALTDGTIRSAQASAYSSHLRHVAFAIARTYAPSGVVFNEHGLTA